MATTTKSVKKVVTRAATKLASKASPKAAAKVAAPPDAITLLKQDHEKVRGLLGQLEKSTERASARRTTLLSQIDTELTVHTQIEEEIFYPAFRDAVRKKEDRKMYYEAKEEHHVVKLVLPEIKETDPTTEEFGAKAKVLKELVEHHAGEEESDMFPEAKKVMDKAELRELGARMFARKQELLGAKATAA